MVILDVLVEYPTIKLDRPFSYLYNGDKFIDKGYRVLVPFNNKHIVGYVIKKESTFKTKEQLEIETGFNLFFIDDVLDETPLINEELFSLAEKIKKYYLCSFISVLQTMLPKSLNVKKSSLRGVKVAYEDYISVNNEIDFDLFDLTPKQRELYNLVKEEGLVLKREIKSKSILKILLDANIFKIIRKEKRRLKLPEINDDTNIKLTVDQENVVNEFLKSDDKIFLLQGVTGSGKTEVYTRLVDEYLKMGKSALILVPEIALTPMMSYQFIKHFHSEVAILHSELTDAERFDEYRKIAKGEIKVVVGVRSAIFAPIKKLGLIIIDEEHVESYKQDKMPYYHAREVAIFRSELTGCKVLLGSATPSLESRARASKNVYHLLRLDKRINQKELPKTQIINLNDKRNIDRDSYLFSLTLRKEIKNILSKKEQAILLVNRRGFATSVTCRNCGHLFKCPNCGIPLTYHKKDNLLKCHHCDYVETLNDICPKCGSSYFLKTGFGTEKIEEEVKRLFPTCRTLRLDSDNAKIRTNIFKTLEKFKNKEADILIGTQMIAKGHDFPNVTLVGVVLADIGLSMPSFRSSERTFQLITQAVGRSGRSDKEGKAIIQTYSIDHYAITLAAKQDYDHFYIKEMGIRKLTQYPPYTFLCNVLISSKNEENVISSSMNIADFLRQRFSSEGVILGPTCPYVSFENDTFKRNILIKYKSQALAHKIMEDLLILTNSNGINIKIDFDPYDF